MCCNILQFILYVYSTVQTHHQDKLFKFAVLFIVHHCILNMRMLLENEWFACMCNIFQSCILMSQDKSQHIREYMALQYILVYNALEHTYFL